MSSFLSECLVCKKSFCSKTGLILHLKNHQKSKNEKSPSPPKVGQKEASSVFVKKETLDEEQKETSLKEQKVNSGILQRDELKLEVEVRRRTANECKASDKKATLSGHKSPSTNEISELNGSVGSQSNAKTSIINTKKSGRREPKKRNWNFPDEDSSSAKTPFKQKCKFCFKMFRHSGDFFIHTLAAHQLEGDQCPRCHKVFFSKWTKIIIKLFCWIISEQKI